MGLNGLCGDVKGAGAWKSGLASLCSFSSTLSRDLSWSLGKCVTLKEFLNLCVSPSEKCRGSSVFWDTEVPCNSVYDCMGLSICIQGRKSTQKIQKKEASGHFSSKQQRHLQTPGCPVVVMHAERSVETGNRTIRNPGYSHGSRSAECHLERFRSAETKVTCFF